jgi:hypothetical protein
MLAQMSSLQVTWPCPLFLHLNHIQIRKVCDRIYIYIHIHNYR